MGTPEQTPRSLRKQRLAMRSLGKADDRWQESGSQGSDGSGQELKDLERGSRWIEVPSTSGSSRERPWCPKMAPKIVKLRSLDPKISKDIHSPIDEAMINFLKFSKC